jgi:hypothetical protein
MYALLTVAQWDQILLGLAWLTAPPTTAFVLVYGLTTRWYRNGFLGYALMFSSLGLAMLMDAALLYRMLGEYQLRPVVLFVIFTFICIGAWLKFIALLVEKWHGREQGSNDDHSYGQVVRDSRESEERNDPTR